LAVAPEILQILVVVQRVIADGIIFLGRCIDDGGVFVGEPWKIYAILL
jgi:hypothetical protein